MDRAGVSGAGGSCDILSREGQSPMAQAMSEARRRIGLLAVGIGLASLGALHPSLIRAADRPNVLFCIADDASSHFGAYGCEWTKTPNFDRVAREGLLFHNVYTPTAKCAPARAAILTGRNPWQLEEAANHQPHFPVKYVGFTEVLRAAGVHVGAQGKTWGPGSAKTAAGAARDFGLPKQPGGLRPGAALQKFLAAREPGQPFFYWFGSSNPHRAYKADAGVAAGKRPEQVDRVPEYWPDNDVVRRDMLDYAMEIEAYDREVGELLEALEEAGELDNTLVIVTSDHGMPFPRVKGHNYDLANRVPFACRWPAGIPRSGRSLDEFVSFIDFAPTILELLQVDGVAAGMAPLTGASLVDLLSGEPTREREFVILGRERNDAYARPGTEAGLGYPVRGIRHGNLLYLHNFQPDRWPCGDPDLGLKDTDDSPTKRLVIGLGEQHPLWQLCFGRRPEEELFDVVADPDCVKNLAEQPAQAAAKRALKERLFTELRRQQDPRVLGEGALFDNYPTARRR